MRGTIDWKERVKLLLPVLDLKNGFFHQNIVKEL